MSSELLQSLRLLSIAGWAAVEVRELISAVERPIERPSRQFSKAQGEVTEGEKPLREETPRKRPRRRKEGVVKAQ